jgi:hypothetical protein
VLGSWLPVACIQGASLIVGLCQNRILFVKSNIRIWQGYQDDSMGWEKQAFQQIVQKIEVDP